jgi:hypothetical protein
MGSQPASGKRITQSWVLPGMRGTGEGGAYELPACPLYAAEPFPAFESRVNIRGGLSCGHPGFILQTFAFYAGIISGTDS